MRQSCVFSFLHGDFLYTWLICRDEPLAPLGGSYDPKQNIIGSDTFELKQVYDRSQTKSYNLKTHWQILDNVSRREIINEVRRRMVLHNLEWFSV